MRCMLLSWHGMGGKDWGTSLQMNWKARMQNVKIGTVGEAFWCVCGKLCLLGGVFASKRN
ncbi:hypothetical protein [Bartonella sp. AA56HLJMS]|uniref:hypothetical protein n=1 Tax=Bartonella sp. AA56HLJMS TaxID=3243434 RepID=UPI0035D0EC4C